MVKKPFSSPGNTLLHDEFIHNIKYFEVMVKFD